MIKILISSFVSFIFFLIIHFSFFYFINPYDKVNYLLGLALLGLIFMYFLLRILPNEQELIKKLRVRKIFLNYLGIFFATLIYALLFLGYLEFYFTADRSITFRMLMITNAQPSKTITQDKMMQIYNVPSIVTKRFDDLLYGGYYQKFGDQYILTSKGEIVLFIYDFAINTLHLNQDFKESLNAKD